MDEPIDTGFAAVLTNPNAVWHPPAEEDVTAAVTTQQALTPAGVEASKALLAMPELTGPLLARLARELAMDIRQQSLILKDYHLNKVQYEFLRDHNDFFKAALHASLIEWNSAMSTQERIKAQAAAALEDKLPDLAIRMGNKSEGLPGVVETAKLFAKIAGVGERDVGATPSGERFTITINLGGDEKLIVGAPQGVSQPGTAAAKLGQLSSNTEGEGSGQTLRPISEGQGDGATFRLVGEAPRSPPAIRQDTEK